jgi:hypothetical protein
MISSRSHGERKVHRPGRRELQLEYSLRGFARCRRVCLFVSRYLIDRDFFSLRVYPTVFFSRQFSSWRVAPSLLSCAAENEVTPIDIRSAWFSLSRHSAHHLAPTLQTSAVER